MKWNEINNEMVFLVVIENEQLNGRKRVRYDRSIEITVCNQMSADCDVVDSSFSRSLSLLIPRFRTNMYCV